jgi:molybdopterin/thiamine biosynthesis adenylyltransferase
VEDVGRMPKVDLAARYIVESGLPVRVHAVGEHLDERNAEVLATADVIVSCVDRHRPRALLNRLAYRALVPLIDTGTAFRVGAGGQMTGDAGRVVVVGPGKRCLSCWGHISPEALRMEALAPEEREALAVEGYISGADVPEPSVVAFNAAVASHAVIELMRLVTGFAGADDPPERLAFSFRDGTVRRNRLADCRLCSICR